MRIVQLVDSLHYGGAEQVVARLATSLAVSGHGVMVVCLRRPGEDSIDYLEMLDAGVRLEALDKPPGAHPKTAKRLVELLRSHGTELINTHNHLVHHYGVAAGRMTGAKVVNTLHGTATLELPLLARLVYWTGCRFSDAVVSVCGAVDRELRRRYWLRPGMLKVIPNGIPLRPFLEIPERAPRGEVIFGNVGRLVEVKGQEKLLRAFAMMHARHPNTRLRVLGGGPLAGRLEAVAKELGIEGSVELLGFSQDVAGFLAGIDVFVLSSRSEGLPLTLLEAMASGVPSVATAVGGVPDVLQPDFGLLAAPGDEQSLAARMEEMLPADRAAMGRRARQDARERYADNVMAAAYEQLYRSLLDGKAAR